MNAQLPCMEVVSFAAKAPFSPTTVVERARGIAAWLEAQPGFVSRVLVGPDAHGTFFDIVRWQNEGSAHAAAEKVMREPAMGAFMEVIDEATVQMRHLPICW